jgi:hypothetical protein
MFNGRSTMRYTDCSALVVSIPYRGASPTLSDRFMPRVCLYVPPTGASVEDWPEASIQPRIAVEGKVYHRYRLSLLSSARMVDEATVYATGPLTPADEFRVFRALFPNRGGVFQIEKYPD